MVSLTGSVKWLVFFWLAWIGALAGFIHWKQPETPAKVLGGFSGVWIAILLFMFWRSSELRTYVRGWWWPPNPPTYKPNSANTIITLFIATVIIPVLYAKTWDSDLNQRIITLERDTVESMNFPSFTIFQRKDWTSQPDLQAATTPKCFLGWHDESAPDCGTSANPDDALPCQCGTSWDDRIQDFQWQNTSYRALKFQASEAMISTSPTLSMLAQTFFSYNTKKALADASRILSPSLFIAVHDPTLTVEEALRNGYTRMVLINANGVVAINLGIEHREALSHAPAYDFQLTISTIPSTTLECETTAACFLTLVFQFPSFERQVLKQDMKLKSPEVASLAGAWFALFQLAGWILSGAAWHT
ncbi:hypothetical protein QBC34DRAFT_296205 [Podospora aff. communis PSN243]|uniref:Uncharacterized protein n=1 Tax=Podospora aff. communis PSN243 TaxID=3040156 RepID=A0AAV9GSK3_9PEZI|nr:hypothetical protein QBC34DRAFT_296205 [Podospora aff. communis PSN243]